MTELLTVSEVIDGLKQIINVGKQVSEQYKAIAPLLLVAALDAELSDTKEQVLNAFRDIEYDERDPELVRRAKKAAQRPFFNVSPYSLSTLIEDQTNASQKFDDYIKSFSPQIREMLTWLQIEKYLGGVDIIKLVRKLGEFSGRLRQMSGEQRNTLFDSISIEAIEKTAENAFEAMTPRDIVQLVCELAFRPHRETLQQGHIIASIYDPAYGTGGFLTQAARYLKSLNKNSIINITGQEVVSRTAAIGRGNLLIADILADFDHFNLSSTSSLGTHGAAFTVDGKQCSYAFCNPPYGNSWKKDQDEVENYVGTNGRFVATPAVSDGQMLFMQQCLSALDPQTTNGQRAIVVSNGSPLFTGSAGSGPSDIRKWILENDWLDAVVGLPSQLFYNTGIQTYLWVFDKNKPAHRKDKVRLVDVSFIPKKDTADEWEKAFCQRMSRNVGDKRMELAQAHCEKILDLVFTEYAEHEIPDNVRIVHRDEFGYRRVTVERPLRLNFQVSADRIAKLSEEKAWNNLLTSRKKGDKAEQDIADGKALQEAVLSMLTAMDGTVLYKSRPEFENVLKKTAKTHGVKVSAPILKAILSALSERDESAETCMNKGKKEPDTTLRDYENIPLNESIEDYMAREVLPHVPDAWVDESKTKTGYEIPFTRYFYEYIPPRPLAEIKTEIQALELQVQTMLQEVLV